MRNFTFLLLFISFGMCFGQDNGSDSCPLRAKNKDWVTEFKTMDNRGDQIDFVVRKIIADSYESMDSEDMAGLNNAVVVEKTNYPSNCYIRFGLLYADNRGLILDLKKNPELEDLISLFNADNISKINLNEYNEKDVYRSFDSKRYGVVMYTDDKELKKKIKRAIREMGKS